MQVDSIILFGVSQSNSTTGAYSCYLSRSLSEVLESENDYVILIKKQMEIFKVVAKGWRDSESKIVDAK